MLNEPMIFHLIFHMEFSVTEIFWGNVTLGDRKNFYRKCHAL